MLLEHTDLTDKLATEQHSNATGTFFSDIDTVQEVEVAKAPDGGWGWFIILGSLLLRITVGTYTS